MTAGGRDAQMQPTSQDGRLWKRIADGLLEERDIHKRRITLLENSLSEIKANIPDLLPGLKLALDVIKHSVRPWDTLCAEIARIEKERQS